jgi:hypothetical protein
MPTMTTAIPAARMSRGFMEPGWGADWESLGKGDVWWKVKAGVVGR